MFKSIESIKSIDDIKNRVLVPPGTYSNILDFSKYIETTNPKLSATDKRAVGISVMSSKLNTKEDMFSKEDLSPTTLVSKINSTTKSKYLKGEAAKTLAYDFLGIGSEIRVLLPHSGFRIMLKTIDNTSRLKLYTKLSEAQKDIGGSTLGFAQSADGVIIADIIMETVEENLLATTLQLEEEESIRDYILAEDYPIIVAGLALALYPNGYEATIGCKNILKTKDGEDKKDEKGKPLQCNNILNAKINIEEMMFSTIEVFGSLSKKVPNTVTLTTDEDKLNELERYQKNIDALQPVEKEYTFNDKIIQITYAPATMSRFIERGNIWVDRIITDLDEILLTNDEEVKIIKQQELINNNILNVYAHIISSISLGNKTIEDMEGIMSILNGLSGTSVVKKIMTDMKHFVDKSTIAGIYLKNYTCEKCKQSIGEEEDALIPINAIEFFFQLTSLNTTTYMERVNSLY